MISKKTVIIAEAGVNHNGDFETACRLIDAAAEAGADYVKFQTFKADSLVTKDAKMAQYQIQNTGELDQSQYQMLKNLELSFEAHHDLVNYCSKKGIRFFSTGFDLESLQFLKTLGMGLWKVPSGEITNLPYLEFIAECNEPVIISTGMSDIFDVRNAVSVFLSKGLSKDKITILHCNTEYPTPYSDVNLNAMAPLGREFGVAFGYSDHTLGIEIPIAAVSLGASVLEKHFTLDRKMKGPDHKSSLEPHELKAMISSIRHVEMALGVSEKIVSPSEFKNRAVARKSIVAKKPIKKGEEFTSDNLTTRRPGDGISPMKWYEILGKTAVRDFLENEKIEL
ncbi:N-acetylneuraminate synthase [Bdellovibrio sp. HCB-110]|uniref:N-acetylneuraminate synthase n=1 Tax=Bdellovibrio sp. HCB-110 TaxID=3391182 RepID=UPI0039B691CD